MIDIKQFVKEKLGQGATRFNFRSKIDTVVFVNLQEKCLLFCSTLGDSRTQTNIKRVMLHTNTIDDKFFEFFKQQLAEYANENPTSQLANVAVVLPDNCVATDTINVPTLDRRTMESGFEVAFQNLYVNHEELKYNKFLTASNKQFGTYTVAMVNKDLIAEINKSCLENKMLAAVVTFPANTTVNAVNKLRSKYKRNSYLLMDVKEDYTRFVFVNKGRSIGSMTLPFGYQSISDTEVVKEEMLFDHSLAEITVVNAAKKARDMLREEQNEVTDAEIESKVYHRATRKLPKYLVRPEPTTPQEAMYENFRFFVKWALSVIRDNEHLTMLGAPEFVLLNMPAEYGFLTEMVNKDIDTNKIEFVWFDAAETDLASTGHYLELYGAFYSKQTNKTNNF